LPLSFRIALYASEKIAFQIHARHADLSQAQVLESVAGAILGARSAGEENSAIARRIEGWSEAFADRDDLDSAATAVADLRLSLIAPDAPRRLGIGGMLASISRWLFEHYPAVAGLSIAAAAVLYGLSYALFYAALGTSPDRAGLNVAQIVGGSASGGLALAAVLVPCLFVAFLPLAVLEDEPEPAHPRQSWRWSLLYAALAALSVLCLWALSQALGGSKVTVSVVGAGVLIWIAVGFLGVTKGPMRWRLPPLAFKPSQFIALLIVLLPLALVVAGVATVVGAARLGEEAQDGQAVDDPRLLGVPFIGLRAESMRVRWVRGAPSRPLPRCLLYLGTAGGQVVAYTAGAESTIRLPANAVELRVGREPAACAAG